MKDLTKLTLKPNLNPAEQGELINLLLEEVGKLSRELKDQETKTLESHQREPVWNAIEASQITLGHFVNTAGES